MSRPASIRYVPPSERNECMCKLHGGKAEAHKLAEYFRTNYKRRPSMMAEIKKF